jgi:hypothetical protein
MIRFGRLASKTDQTELCDFLQVGFQFSGLTYALVSVLFFIPVLLVIRYGEGWRRRLGTPDFNRGI